MMKPVHTAWVQITLTLTVRAVTRTLCEERKWDGQWAGISGQTQGALPW